MPLNKKLWMILSSVLVCSVHLTFAAEEHQGIEVENAWVRAMPPSHQHTSAYMTITNYTNGDVVLRSVTTDAAQAVEMHKIESVEGVMRMELIEEIIVPGKAQVDLEPGGMHLMLINLKKTLKEEDTISFDFSFQDGSKKIISALVSGDEIQNGLERDSSMTGTIEEIRDLQQLNPTRDFTLHDHNGEKFHLKDHRGKIVFLFFGYLSCPDICPLTLSRLVQLNKLLESDQDRILTVFISVDPERDTQEKIKEYLQYFDLNVVGLTGSEQEINAVVEMYQAFYKKVLTTSVKTTLYSFKSIHDQAHLLARHEPIRTPTATPSGTPARASSHQSPKSFHPPRAFAVRRYPRRQKRSRWVASKCGIRGTVYLSRRLACLITYTVPGTLTAKD